jgi:hypothetical protein
MDGISEWVVSVRLDLEEEAGGGIEGGGGGGEAATYGRGWSSIAP